MPNFPRTDLAVEAEAIHRSAAAVTELPGVRAEETNRRGFSVTEVHVLDAAGENALCKPIGDYYTLALDPLLRREDDAFENAAQTLSLIHICHRHHDQDRRKRARILLHGRHPDRRGSGCRHRGRPAQGAHRGLPGQERCV